MDISIQSVFAKIREISALGIHVRPYIAVNLLETEMGTSLDKLAPCLVGLKKMRLILFDHKAMTAVKLTHLGLQWELMPR